MYQVVTIDQGRAYVEDFDDLAEAEGYARDMADSGMTATLCMVMQRHEAEELPTLDLAKEYGVRPGVDFPGSLPLRVVAL